MFQPRAGIKVEESSEVESGKVEIRRDRAAKRQHACELMQPTIKRRAAAGLIRRL
jgi:hypothetical protein